MSEHGLFAINVLSHLVALMSGIVSFILAVIQEVRKKPHHSLVFWIIGALCLLVAFDQAWRDEHHNLQGVIAEKAGAVGKENICDGDFRAEQIRSRSLDVLNKTLQSQLSGEQGVLGQQQVTMNSQQNAMNSCVVALGKANTPEPQNTVIGFANADFKDMPESKHRVLLYAFTNRAMPSPTKGIMLCEKMFKYASLSMPGATLTNEGTHAIPSQTLDFNVVSPQWTPTNPLIFVISYDGDDLGRCGIRLQ